MATKSCRSVITRPHTTSNGHASVEIITQMTLHEDAFGRLEWLIYRPVSTRPDWLKAWRNEANYLLFLARRASDDEDDELLEELEAQARDMADMVEARFRAEGL
jgi:hypothetical protein